jgi:glucoamylase
MMKPPGFVSDYERISDGPPIRALFLMDYAHWLLDNNNGTWVADNLWSAIHLDLMWVSLHWNETS